MRRTTFRKTTISKIMYCLTTFMFFLTLIFCTSCSKKPQSSPEELAKQTEISHEELRKVQTRVYDTPEYNPVMKSILNTLQDEGFVVRNVAFDLGFLTATKETDVERHSQSFWDEYRRSPDSRFTKQKVIEATVSVNDIGNKIRVRINFQEKTIDNRGALMKLGQVSDPKIYTEFFSKIDKDLFVQDKNA